MLDMTVIDPKFIIVPIGTQIVVREGSDRDQSESIYPNDAVGSVTNAPIDNTQPYEIRLIDGTEILLERAQFAIRKHHQQSAIANIDVPFDDAELSSFISDAQARL